jgi:hypothetical protein
MYSASVITFSQNILRSLTYIFGKFSVGTWIYWWDTCSFKSTHFVQFTVGGQDSIVSIVTHYSLDVPRMKYQWGQDFLCHPDPVSCTVGNGSSPGVNWWKHGADHQLFLVPGCTWVGAILGLPSVPERACHGVAFTCKVAVGSPD